MSEATPQQERPDPPLETVDLSLIDSYALAKELADRHPDGCIIYCEGDEESGSIFRRLLRGKPSMLLGMLTRVRRTVWRCIDGGDE